MGTKTISHVQGKGSIAHNNRDFMPNNVDPERTPDNITYVREDIAAVYDKLFSEAVKEYNARQKRNDRRVKGSYYEELFNHKPCSKVLEASDSRKSFYEDVVQIGTMHDTAVGSPDGEIAKQCLDEYMKSFQERNPNFYVFNAVMHLDEKTPHLQFDYVPVGHYTRGIPIQNGLAQALKEMGYGGGKDAINRWRQAERKVLKDICIVHGLEISDDKPGRGYSMKVEEYKDHEDRIQSYEKREKELTDKLDAIAEAEKIADSVEIEHKTILGNVIVSQDDFEQIQRQRKALMLKEKEMHQLNAHLDTERVHTSEKAKELDKREKQLNSREQALEVKETDIAKREEEANNLYQSQIALNEKYKQALERNSGLVTENNRLEEFEKKCSKLSDQLDHERMEHREYKEKTEKEHKAEVDELVRERDEAVTQVMEKDSIISKLRKKISALDKLIDTLYEVGQYISERFGLDIDFDKAVKQRDEGYKFSYIFDDNNNYER